jgi:hypothetical protein
MFVGLSWLADQTNVVYTGEHQRTLVAQVALAVFGGGPLFYVVQVMTALILVLAANTAYTGFPVLGSILARDRIMPRQFRNRGDRLVFSNGIVILAAFATLLVYLFDANLNRLIQLYLVGVLLSFTLAQFGTVIRWRKTRETGWRRRAFINAVGGTATAIVLVVVVVTKFAAGAWIVIAALPVLMFAMRSIRRHYDDVAGQLADPDRIPENRRPGNQHMTILVERINETVARAVAYARAVGPADISAVTFDGANLEPWNALGIDVDLVVLDGGGSRVATLRGYLRERRGQTKDDDFMTLVIPEELRSTGLLEIITHPTMHRLKAAFLRERGIQILDIPLAKRSDGSSIEELAASLQSPARHLVCVLVSGVHNSTLQAIEYAETLQAAEVQAVSFVLEPEESERLLNDWLDARIPHSLEIVASPFRDIGRSLCGYLRQYRADGLDRVITVVIPEFIVSKRRHQFLHGQTALIIKRHLLFEPGVVAVSVPYHLEEPVAD